MAQLALVRHGQSQWNLEDRFTGWWVNLCSSRIGPSAASRTSSLAFTRLPNSSKRMPSL